MQQRGPIKSKLVDIIILGKNSDKLNSLSSACYESEVVNALNKCEKYSVNNDFVKAFLVLDKSDSSLLCLVLAKRIKGKKNVLLDFDVHKSLDKNIFSDIVLNITQWLHFNKDIMKFHISKEQFSEELIKSLRVIGFKQNKKHSGLVTCSNVNDIISDILLLLSNMF